MHRLNGVDPRRQNVWVRPGEHSRIAAISKPLSLAGAVAKVNVTFALAAFSDALLAARRMGSTQSLHPGPSHGAMALQDPRAFRGSLDKRWSWHLEAAPPARSALDLAAQGDRDLDRADPCRVIRGDPPTTMHLDQRLTLEDLSRLLYRLTV